MLWYKFRLSDSSASSSLCVMIICFIGPEHELHISQQLPKCPNKIAHLLPHESLDSQAIHWHQR